MPKVGGHEARTDEPSPKGPSTGADRKREEIVQGSLAWSLVEL